MTSWPQSSRLVLVSAGTNRIVLGFTFTTSSTRTRVGMTSIVMCPLRSASWGGGKFNLPGGGGLTGGSERTHPIPRRKRAPKGKRVMAPPAPATVAQARSDLLPGHKPDRGSSRAPRQSRCQESPDRSCGDRRGLDELRETDRLLRGQLRAAAR